MIDENGYGQTINENQDEEAKNHLKALNKIV